jgi:phenylpropionate dioxygenase-like ring-hydroxylating dioxygenase large terminal subunit
MLRTVFILGLYLLTDAFMVTPPFNRWHCIDFVKNIDKSKPYAFNIGELSLVSWFDTNNNPHTTVNICSHMGSRLDNGKVTDGCLVCPYHGLQHNQSKSFGQSMIFQDKLWWSYEPVKKMPPAMPFYNNKKYETSYIKIDIDANIVDCAFNTMDVNHPAHIHNNLFGFGSNIPPTNLHTVMYPNNTDKIGLTFTYKSKSNLAHLKRELRRSKNFHVYEYPFTTWSRVSLPTNEHLFVNVNMLPLSPNKTRWLVTLKHNFWKTSVEKRFMKFAADCILYQDKEQMKRQSEESALKKMVIYQEEFAQEEHFKQLRDMFKDYNVPDTQSVLQLYARHKLKINKTQ